MPRKKSNLTLKKRPKPKYIRIEEYKIKKEAIGTLQNGISKNGINLLKQENRFIYDPQDPEIVKFVKKAQACEWVTEEIDLSEDAVQWEKKLTDDDRSFISKVLAFFAASDGIVNENLAQRFSKDIQLPEVRMFLAIQMKMESIHSETYAMLLQVFIKNKSERNSLFNAIHTIPSIKKKAEWAIKWLEDEESSFAERLLAFACVEGIFFSGSFCAIFWLKEKGLMPGLGFGNALIFRDETLHYKHAIYLLKEYMQLSAELIKKIILSAVECECVFVRETLSVDLIGMNAKMLTQYIQFIGDQMFSFLDIPKVFNVENPFPFMDRITLPEKTNFFEKKVGEYQKAFYSQNKTLGKENFNPNLEFW
jgi:ribonucleotide reductase beta subunit family protein with ferritin-like domain